jgi:periplasmic mercuric ion binding protein
MRKLIIVLFSILTVNAWAQKETVNILTSAPCVGMLCCKEKIEEKMQFTRGVTAVDLEIETGILTVTFKTKKTDADKLRKVISSIGYNADDVKANEQAHDNLPSCCQHLDFEGEK